MGRFWALRRASTVNPNALAAAVFPNLFKIAGGERIRCAWSYRGFTAGTHCNGTLQGPGPGYPPIEFWEDIDLSVGFHDFAFEEFAPGSSYRVVVSVPGDGQFISPVLVW